jgi:hypothetical protein
MISQHQIHGFLSVEPIGRIGNPADQPSDTHGFLTRPSILAKLAG